MSKNISQQLMSRLIDHVVNDSSDESEDSITEAASFFTDPKRFEKERQQFFLETPQLIGFSGSVSEPNSFMTVECMGIPIVVTRNGIGELKAFINACSHRGARVAEGAGNKKTMSCGFHGWTYNLDGSLVGVPKQQCFNIEKADCGLKALPIVECQGLLLVGLSQDVSMPRLKDFLAPLDNQLAEFNFSQLENITTRKFNVAANWKLVVSLSHESYHFAKLHGQSLAPMMTSHSVFDEFGWHTRWAFPLKGIERWAEKPVSDWPARLPGAISHTLFPGTVIVVNAKDAQIIRVEPGASADQSVVYYMGACGKGDSVEESVQAYNFGGDIFANEDLPAAEQCQQGLTVQQNDIVIGRNEPVVQLWHQRWHSALKDE
jgi:phenylpropionate dioxygenase-like ring-hydroxylating dioxygenase large terminal subunit